MNDYSVYINLKRYIYQSRTDLMTQKALQRFIWHLLGMSGKREKLILEDVCSKHDLVLIKRSDLTKYKQTKFKKYLMRSYGPGWYLLPRARVPGPLL